MLSRFFSAIFGLALLVAAGAQGYAFMLEREVTPDQSGFDLVQLIEGLQSEMQDDAINTEEMLAKLDDAIKEIDSVLDSGVEDEESYLIARDALIDMRLEVSKASEAPKEVLAAGNNRRLALPLLGNSGGGGILGGGGGVIGGGGGGFAGGGGGGLIGGSPLRLLAIGGAAIGIAVGAGGDDDEPGPPATVAAN